MNELLNAMFGLDPIAFGDEGVRFEFARAIPAWGWALIALGAAALGAAGYARLLGDRRARLALATVRTLALLLIAVLAAGPQLVRQSTTTEEDAVIVLADRSASMAVADGSAAGRTRDEHLKDTIRAASETWQEIAADKRLLWYGFDAAAYRLDVPPEEDQEGATPSPTLGDAEGDATRLGSAIARVLDQQAGRPVSGVLVLSDGGSSDRATAVVSERLAAERVPVFTVPFGSPDPVPDVSVARVETPRRVFPRDRVPIRVTLEHSGLADDAQRAAGPGRLELIDERTGRVLQSREIAPEDRDADEPMVLFARADEPGEQPWSVRFRPAGPDLLQENNRRQAPVIAVDRDIRVLYIDGYPRWEQRYLKTLLIREQSTDVTAVLLAANRRYQQDGNTTIDRLPTSPEEWAEFDLVILGDVRGQLFGSAQLLGLRSHVSQRGAGLLWLAGPASVPQSWHGTDLGDLLPLRASETGSAGVAPPAPPTFDEDVVLRPTEAARRLGLLSVDAQGDAALPPAIFNPGLGWPRLRWAQRLEAERLKPAVAVLARALPATQPEASQASPLVLSMRFGAGQLAYVGTDDLWRWRYGRGEVLYERFWIPLVRSLGRSALERGEAGVSLVARPSEATIGQTVTPRLELFDPALIEILGDRIAARVETEEGEPLTNLTLSRDPTAAGTRVAYTAAWTPADAGRYMIRTDEPALAQADPAAAVTVVRPNDERRRPQANHALLRGLADSSDGLVLNPDELQTLPGLLPNRSRVSAGPREVATLWDRPWALALVVLLLAGEWVGRRLIRLS